MKKKKKGMAGMGAQEAGEEKCKINLDIGLT